ncbi:MAG: alpha/beta family hydrolase [Terriglobia bacterium]|jgi:predicted alpha/beta-hydrolase family hydrolase|nr:alpha/beta family hydrolase [Terriglobia bacterium]
MNGCSVREFTENPSDGINVRGFLHIPEISTGYGLVLTHGAGANCQSQLLVAISRAFCEAGFGVLRCDLPFRQLRPHGPPVRGSAERDQLGLRRAIEALRKHVPGRVFAGGHSYGGRQATLLLTSEPGLVEGLLLLSYPLHPPKNPEQLRTEHFPRLRTPALFVHGARDGFATHSEISKALKLIPAKTRLLEIENAGHELLSRKNAEELPKIIVQTSREMFGAAETGS